MTIRESVQHMDIVPLNEHSKCVVWLSIENTLADSVRKLLVGALEFMTSMGQISLCAAMRDALLKN